MIKFGQQCFRLCFCVWWKCFDWLLKDFQTLAGMNYEDSSNIRLLDMSIVQLMIDAFLWRVNWELKLQPAFDVKLPKAFNQRYYHSFYWFQTFIMLVGFNWEIINVKEVECDVFFVVSYLEPIVSNWRGAKPNWPWIRT